MLGVVLRMPFALVVCITVSETGEGTDADDRLTPTSLSAEDRLSGTRSPSDQLEGMREWSQGGDVYVCM